MHGAPQILGSDCRESTEFSSRRILLADREPIYLRGLRTILEEASGFRVIDTAINSQQVVAHLSLHQPRLLITGFRLACGRDAMGLASELRSSSQDTAIIVLLPPSSAILIGRLVNSGIRGVLTRCASPEVLLPAIRKVLAGEMFVDPALTATPAHGSSATADADLSILTDREREVFHLLGSENAHKEIACRLGISSKTVERHRENIKAKLCLGTGCSLQLSARAHVLREACGANYTI